MSRQDNGRLISKPPFALIAVAIATLSAIVFAWLFQSCFAGPWVSEPWDPPVVRTSELPLDAGDGAVLPSTQTLSLSGQCSRRSPTPVWGKWSPSSDQIQQLEADLAQVLRSIDDTLTRYPGERPIGLRSYRRQYVGIELMSRERIIYVSAFEPHATLMATRDSMSWRHEPVIVCDGGRGYWGIEYEPLLRRFRRFAFNGVG